MKQSAAKRLPNRMETFLFIFSGAILLIPLVICITVYLFYMSFAIDQTIDMQFALMRNGISEVHSTLQEVDTYLNTVIGQDEQAKAFLSAKREPSNERTALMRAFLNSQLAFDDPRKIVAENGDIWFYSRTNGCITNGFTSFSTLHEFAKYLNLDPPETILEQALDYSETYGFFPITVASENQVLYVHKVFSRFTCIGKAFCILNTKQILQILKGYSLPDLPSETVLFTGERVVYSSLDQALSENLVSGEISTENNGILRLGSTSYVALRTGMDDYGLSLLLLIPRSYFQGYALQSTMMVLKKMIPLVALGFLLLLTLLLYNQRFLYDILHIFEPSRADAATSNPYKYLRQSVRQLNHTREEQRLLLENSYNEIKEATLTSIAHRSTARVENLREKLAEYGIELNSECFSGLILTLFTEEGSAMQVTDREHMSVLNIIGELFPEIQYVKMDGPYQMLLLSGFDETPGHTEGLSDQLRRICSAVAQTFHCRVYICAGREVKKIEHLAWSFETARNMLPSMQANGTPVFLCQKSAMVKTVYSYSDNDSHELIQATSLSNMELLSRKLNSILEKNRDIIQTPFERQLLYAHMISTLIKAGYSGEFDDEILFHLSEISTESFFRKMENYYATLCKVNETQKEQQQLQMTEGILSSIRNHLADYEYTLAELSAEFGLSERQMQQCVMAKTGMSFSAWLEHCRIDKAAELLQNPDMKITEIAEMTGYASDKSFRRAFKRVTGNAPSQTRRTGASSASEE